MKTKHTFKERLFRLPRDFSEELFTKDLIKVTSGHGFRSEYLHSELLSKYLDEKSCPKSTRATRAIEKFLDAEESNRRTNCRLLFAEDHSFGWVETEKFLSTVRKFVANLMGPIDDWVPDKHFTIGNGASCFVRRSPTAAQNKLSGELECTEKASEHLSLHIKDTILSELRLVHTPNSVLFTVPKKSDIDRVACKEPAGNMLLQRSVGKHLQRRLRRFGIDLRDQSKNQRLAREALDRGLATIDLSSASDRISRGLVIKLLPWEWWSLLDDIRSHEIYIKWPNGNTMLHETEMFSSMGNGFTFELETIIFYALTRAVCYHSRVKGIISVYGDDILAPSKIVPRLIRVFSYFGFKVNEKKTNYRGPFRESCGAHFHRGFEVTPFYIRGKITRVPDLILVMNQATNWLSFCGMLSTEEELIWWHKWARFIPKRFWGGQSHLSPDSLVSGHSPRYRIVPKVEAVSADTNGAYRLWLLRTRDRTRLDEHLVTSVADAEVGLKQARNRTWERTHLNPLLLETVLNSSE